MLRVGGPYSYSDSNSGQYRSEDTDLANYRTITVPQFPNKKLLIYKVIYRVNATTNVKMAYNWVCMNKPGFFFLEAINNACST